MISAQHNQRRHPTAFQPPHYASISTSPQIQSTTALSDLHIPRSASIPSETGFEDDVFSLDSVYPNSPMSQDFYSHSPAITIQRPSAASGQDSLAAWPQRVVAHQRNSSSSSIGSDTSASSFAYSPLSAYSHVGHPDSSPLMAAANKFDSFTTQADDASRTFSNNLPTPTYTPVQDSFNSFPHYTQAPNLDSTMAAHLAMAQGMKQDVGEEDIPGFSHSSRHSVSSFGNSPSTPQHVDDVDDVFKTTDMSRHNHQRSLPHNIKDDLTNLSIPNMNVQQYPQQNLLTPYTTQNQKLNELLQKANKNRANSPSAFAARGASPFRQNSPLAYSQARLDTFGANQTPLRQQQDVRAFTGMAHQQNETPKTISPKDALLEHSVSEEDAKMPLFPEASNDYMPQQQVNYQYNDAWMTTQPPTATSQAAFTFTAPAMDLSNNALVFPPSSHPGRSLNRLHTSVAEATPDFPAHLTRMESSVSEAAPDSSQPEQIQRPDSTLARSGTYSCTYQGCVDRFDTPQRLQKHKKEVHRQSGSNTQSPSSPIGSNMSSAALLARNSQAGPHKCARVNPTTGKPCNVVFSRPYDLTRHEDTIHNNIKHKVRCAYCVEEKTFSRNDALTRHMRVVHSDVNFPGKHRRRGHE